MNDPRIVVLGHVHLDVVARDLQPFDCTRSFSLGTVSAIVGGSVAHLARALRSIRQHTAVCCVGDDSIGRILQHFVSTNYDNAIILEKRAKSVSIVPILYREAGREIIGPIASANDMLTVDDVKAPDVLTALSAADIFIVDGYSARLPPGREACSTALAQAKATGAITVVDVVPHHAHNLYSWDDLRRLVACADVIVVEARTLAQFCGLKPDTRPDEIASICRATFPQSLCILRYGEQNIRTNRFVTANVDVVRESSDAPDKLIQAGYGDQLLVAQLHLLWHTPEALSLCRDTLPWRSSKMELM